MKRWIIIGTSAAGFLLILSLYSIYRINLRPPKPDQPNPISFSISPGESTPGIAKRLQDSGIIRDRQAFMFYVTIHGLRRNIEAGYYELSPADSAITNAKIIARGIVVNKSFLVREGDTILKIQANADQAWLHGPDLPAALKESYPNDFLASRPAGATLEGYLFPDTYSISPQTSAHQLVQSMLNNFGQKVTPEIIDGLADQKLSLHQGIILASIIQSEVSNPADMPIVSQIFFKRLQTGMKLESSVTAFYGARLNGQTATEATVLSVDSPYNTYLHAGLPPGPVSNPGIEAIRAVINPADSDFLYFIADKQGNSHFANTYAEHQANVAKYLQ